MCTAAFVGDRDRPIDVEPGAAVDGQFVPLADGAALPLVPPPQGGHVSFVAARARNVDPCRVTIAARVRSDTTGLIVAEESRGTSLIEEPDGWAAPNAAQLSQVANVPLCPDYFVEGIVDVSYRLEVTLQDARGAAWAGRVERAVVPRCLETDAYEAALCRCECSGGYRLGRCADPFDAGVP